MSTTAPASLSKAKAYVALAVTLITGFAQALLGLIPDPTTQLVLQIVLGFATVVSATVGVYAIPNKPVNSTGAA